MQHFSTTSSEPPAERKVPELEFKALTGRIPKGSFSCGEREIDSWLLDAHKEHERLRCRVTTAHLKGNPLPAAFYGLRICVESDADIDGHGGGFRIEKGGVFAAVQLCYIGTQRALQKQGIGGVVMAHALRGFADVARLTGICAMTLVAINEERALWYEGLGFSRYGKPCDRPKLFLPARTAIELVGG